MKYKINLKIIYSILGTIFFIILAIGSADNNKKVSANKMKKAVLINEDFSSIWENFKPKSKLNDLKKKKMWAEKYKGKKVIWTGTVVSLDKTFGQLILQVKILPSSLTADVLVYFDKKWENKLIDIDEGSAVKFSGILEDYNSVLGHLELRHGELIEDNKK